MQKITDFIKTQRHIITWTITYVFIMWAILRGLFNFNIFSPVHWSYLLHLHLRGFAGLVFGILILAALPMYIATTTLVARNGAPLFKVPVPQFLVRAFSGAPVAQPENDDVAPTTDDTDAPADKPLPDNLPTELRSAFLRARERVGNEQFSSFDVRVTDATPVPATAPKATDTMGDLPLPSNFDDVGNFSDFAGDTIPQDFDTPPATPGISVPVFKDISFDGFDDDTVIEIPNATGETTPDVAPTATEPRTDRATSVTDFMGAHNIPIVATDDDVVVTNKYAIATHDDPSFWVADADTWFATGRQKPSPVAAAIRVATAHNVTPVLYLACDKIMNIATRRSDWEKSGVIITSDLGILL